ncbi:MAG: 3-methyl-2-oxobutanoate dehydrogenase subunit VorB [Oscillospiraceae bacterium]|nr:3-methyl-2-oxobutanoate dehydrogenase subunit VorB [Oscillospiraceae bacterium]
MSQRVLMKGNEALAEAAIRAGCHHFFGYPITPQNEIVAYMSKRLPKIEGACFLQAESEIAAINMLLGASAAGARVMTSSSSPGISLKTEGISYIAGSDLPVVVVNTQRAGPGLGGIQPSQADYWQATKAPGHGDLRVLVFAPCSVQEMVDMVTTAFDMADKYRMPAIILADGMLGQMMEAVTLPEDRGRQANNKEWATNGHAGENRNIINSLYINPDELEKIIRDRFARYAEIEAKHTQHEEYALEDADIVVTAYGASARVAKAAVRDARAKGIKAGFIRPITLWPFPKEAYAKAANTARSFLCVEMSMGQMVDDVRLAISSKVPVHFYGRPGGIVPAPEEVLAEIEKIAGGMN